MICFQISIFEPLETTILLKLWFLAVLWFAFKLVSLNHWKQLTDWDQFRWWVVICFQISIFEPLETTIEPAFARRRALWFAFKLVSLNHWKQLAISHPSAGTVVICFQISIFEPLETTAAETAPITTLLWFAFKLVSLNHWKQPRLPLFLFPNSCDLLSN